MSRFCRLRLSDGAECYAEIDGARAYPFDCAPWLGGKRSGGDVALSGIELLPAVDSSKIVCIGKNYRAHAAEMGGEAPAEPLLFLKPPSSLLASGGTVILPKQSVRVDYEGELGVVIGRRARAVTREAALDFVFGYTIVCDVTARDLQFKDGQWTRAKGFDTFCPVGPHVVAGVDASACSLRLAVNGAVKQDANTRDLVHDVPTLVSYISHVMTLEPGDLISTGTPEGVGPIESGDRVVVTIEGLGELSFDAKGA